MKLGFFRQKVFFSVVYIVEDQVDDGLVYHSYKVCKRGEQILVEDSKKLSTHEALKGYLGNMPVILLVFGQNVIYTSNISMYNETLDEFYFSEYKTESPIGSIFSLSRKTYIDNLKESFIEAKLNLIDVTLGVSTINLLYLKEFVVKNIRVDAVQIRYDTQDCIEINHNDFNAGEKNYIESLILSVVIDYVFKSDKISSNTSFDDLERNRLEGRDKLLVEKLINYGFPSVFILISLFYVLGMFFNKKNSVQQSTRNATAVQEQKFSSLKGEIAKKKELITTLGVLRKHTHVYYINEIVKLLPSSIVLSEINLSPLLKKTQEHKRVLIDKGVILIKGKLQDKKSFSQWIENLQKMEDIRKVDISKFEKRNHDVDFELLINLN